MISGGEPPIDARDGASIGLVRARGVEITAALRQGTQAGGYARKFARHREFGAQRIELIQIFGQKRLGRAAQPEAQRVGGDVRVAVTIAADPTAQTQEACWTPSDQALPTCVEHRHSRQKNVPQIGQRRIDFVRHIQPFPPQRPRLPQQRDLRRDALLDQFTFRRFRATGVALPHQRCNAVAMIQHALAHHFGRVRRQDGRDQRSVQQRGGFCGRDALRAQQLQGRGQCVALFRGRALPVFGKIGQHGEQHEAAHEGDGLVERQRLESSPQPAGVGDPPVAVDGRRPYGFDALKQGLAAVGTNHIAQEFAQKSNIGVLSDGGRAWWHDGQYRTLTQVCTRSCEDCVPPRVIHRTYQLIRAND